MKELLQNIFEIAKAIFTEWIPSISKMEDATWGPLEAIISKAGKTIAIISAIIAILKLLDKYGIETWNSEPKQKKREKEETTENEP